MNTPKCALELLILLRVLTLTQFGKMKAAQREAYFSSLSVSSGSHYLLISIPGILCSWSRYKKVDDRMRACVRQHADLLKCYL